MGGLGHAGGKRAKKGYSEHKDSQTLRHTSARRARLVGPRETARPGQVCSVDHARWGAGVALSSGETGRGEQICHDMKGVLRGI